MTLLQTIREGEREFEKDVSEYKMASIKTPSRLNEEISPMILGTIEIYRKRYTSQTIALLEAQNEELDLKIKREVGIQTVIPDVEGIAMAFSLGIKNSLQTTIDINSRIIAELQS